MVIIFQGFITKFYLCLVFLDDGKHIHDFVIQLFQFTLSDQSFKGTGQDRKAVWVD